VPSVSWRSKDILGEWFSSFDPHKEGQVLEVECFTKFRNSEGNSFDSVPLTPAGVSGLLGATCPFTVFRRVWAIAIFSFKSVMPWSGPHVSSKCGQGLLPSSAHSDGRSFPSVEVPVFESRVSASPYHRLPSIVEGISLLESKSIPLVARYAFDAVVALRSNAAIFRSEFMSMFAEIICPTLHTTSIARAEGGMPFLLGVY